MSIEQRFISFILFLFFRMCLASVHPANLIMTFLCPLLFNQSQSYMRERSIFTSNLSKILRFVYSRSMLLILSGTPVISKHSRLKYWLFPQYCLSNATTCSCCLHIWNDKLRFNYSEVVTKFTLRSLFILDTVLSNFSWYSKINSVTSSFVSFLKVASESDIFNSKTRLTLLAGS